MDSSASGGALYPARDTRRTSFFTPAAITSTQDNHLNSLHFDASRSSAIYGKSTTVQPPALAVNIWKRTA